MLTPCQVTTEHRQGDEKIQDTVWLGRPVRDGPNNARRLSVGKNTGKQKYNTGVPKHNTRYYSEESLVCKYQILLMQY
jgi:hypothetical protein